MAGCLGSARPESPACPAETGTDADARIGFVGDVMLGRSVNDHWYGSDPAGVWGSTLPRLRALDGLVANLECCVSARGRRFPGKTYYFRAHPAFAVPALSAAGASVVSLANNHTLDFGTIGLRDTLAHLDDAGIDHAGAGPDRAGAFRPAVTQIGGLTVGTVALTDQLAAYSAGPDTPGTAYLPLVRTNPTTRQVVGDAIDRARTAGADLVVASLHWGPNWETRPDGGQRRFARWLVDRGVDVVHGHSAHVLQGIERYRGRPILYDAGDFVDDYIHKDGYRNKRSGLFELVVEQGTLSTLRVHPIEIDDETATIAGPDAATWVRETLVDRSNPFGTTLRRRDDGVELPLDTC
jgi:poly-gamma-glutamate synthesis protein (capsule biosynthesis protein)